MKTTIEYAVPGFAAAAIGEAVVHSGPIATTDTDPATRGSETMSSFRSDPLLTQSRAGHRKEASGPVFQLSGACPVTSSSSGSAEAGAIDPRRFRREQRATWPAPSSCRLATGSDSSK